MPEVLGKGGMTGGNEVLGRVGHTATRGALDGASETSRLVILGKKSLP